MTIFGIDPGSTESGYALVGADYNIIDAGKISNSDILSKIIALNDNYDLEIACESIQSYGMIMGKSTIETCYQIGKILRTAELEQVAMYLYPRPEYGKYICGPKVKDPLIRSALENRFGGYKKNEPLFKLAGASDKRSAYAVAVYHIDRMSLNND